VYSSPTPKPSVLVAVMHRQSNTIIIGLEATHLVCYEQINTLKCLCVAANQCILTRFVFAGITCDGLTRWRRYNLGVVSGRLSHQAAALAQ